MKLRGFYVDCKGNALVSCKGVSLKQGPRVAELALPKSVESGTLGSATVRHPVDAGYDGGRA